MKQAISICEPISPEPGAITRLRYAPNLASNFHQSTRDFTYSQPRPSGLVRFKVHITNPRSRFIARVTHFLFSLFTFQILPRVDLNNTAS
jgi:hypothetical protein